jgi:hypothetical protein
MFALHSPRPMSAVLPEGPSRAQPARRRGVYRPHWPSVAAFSLAASAVLVGWYINGGKSDDFDVLAGRVSLTEGVRQSAGWLAGGLALALLMLVVRPSGVRWHTRPIGALLDLLALHWRALLVAYGVVIVAWAATVVALRPPAWPLLFDALFSHSGLEPDDSVFWYNVAFAAAFVVLQLVFISGVGGVRIRREPARPWKLTFSIAVFAVATGLAAWGTVAACLQLVDRIDASSGRQGLPIVSGTLAAAVLSASWLFWLGAGWVLARGVPRETALGRMITLVLAGSWIEFMVALPVELVTRDRTKDCPCGSGSWVALVSAGPLLLWSIGPGIFLLYRFEWQRTQEDPAHARRVLQRKTRRNGARR